MVLILQSREIPGGYRKPPTQTVWSRGGDSCTRFQRAARNKLCANVPCYLERPQTVQAAPCTPRGVHTLQWPLRFPTSLVSRPLSAAQSLVILIRKSLVKVCPWILATKTNGSILQMYVVK